MKWKGIIILLFFNTIIFVFIVYKINRDQHELKIKFGYSEATFRHIKKLECSSESRSYEPIFFVGKDTIHPVQYSGKFPILICNFSVQSCAPCYETMLELVIESFPDYKEREDIIFLCNDLEYRYRDKFYGKKIYSSAVDNQLNIEKENIPFFLILDRNYKTDLVMFADKSRPTIIKEYLEIVKEKINRIP